LRIAIRRQPRRARAVHAAAHAAVAKDGLNVGAELGPHRQRVFVAACFGAEQRHRARRREDRHGVLPQRDALRAQQARQHPLQPEIGGAVSVGHHGVSAPGLRQHGDQQCQGWRGEVVEHADQGHCSLGWAFGGERDEDPALVRYGEGGREWQVLRACWRGEAGKQEGAG
ncbi:6338_t:CDS:1, partial [Scutellospora calospora]